MVYIAIVGVTTVIFGIASLLLISRARNKLSEGSIRRFMDNFAICLAFIVTFSLWQTLRDVYGVGRQLSGQTTYLSYPEYIFIIFAYIAFIITSYRIQNISKEFGFKGDGKKIEQIMNQKSADAAKVQTAIVKTKIKPKKSKANKKNA